MGSVKRATPKQSSRLMQPKVGTLIHELRQLAKLTQVQLAEVLGVSYETINRWENGHIQPSPLALKQIQLFVNELSLSSSKVVQDKSKLLAAYFGEEQQ